MSSREIMAKLKTDGWELVQIRGSHHHFKHPTKAGRVTVPHPKRDLPIGLSEVFIAKQVGNGSQDR